LLVLAEAVDIIKMPVAVVVQVVLEQERA